MSRSARALRRRNHPVTVGQRQAHDFVGDDVLACCQRPNRQIGMGVVGRRNDHGVYVRVVKGRVIAGVCPAVLLRADRVQLCRVVGRHAVEFQPCGQFDQAAVAVAPPPAVADNGDAGPGAIRC